MSVFLLLLILSEVLLPNPTCASRVRRQATKVRISAVGDTITLRFLEPHRETKLEGYILGYGSSLFSKQLIQLPDDGEPYETEIDAEPKYLVAVQPVKEEQVKKQCTGKESLEKPLHLVIGSVSPTSVMLSWATLLNTLSTETNLDDCTEDGHYTVRYREKEPKKTWNYQTCPTTDTIIDDLKPDTPYEFGVRAKFENINGAWSPSVTHNTDETDVHKILEPENLFQPEPPSTEEPQTFSPSVPVLHIVQRSPAPPLTTPEPPPTQRITEAKDRDVYKPLKPENLLRPVKPVTESPQTFPPSVPVLSSTIQSRPASLIRPPGPPPTQRIIQDTHEPLKPDITPMPENPITEGPQASPPSVPDLHSVHTAPPPTQKIIQAVHKTPQPMSRLRHKKPTTERPQSFSSSVAGTGSDAIRTSHPSEDSLFLTQTPTSAHTPMSNFETNDILQTQHYTVSSLSITTQQPLHTIQSKMTTSKPPFKTLINKTKTVPSTVTAQHNVTQKRKTQLHQTIDPETELITTKFQTSTSTFQMRKTQFQEHTAKYPLTAAHAKPTSPQPHKIHSQTSIEEIQHSTTKGQFKMLEPITTQSEPHPSQTLSIMTQSQPHITHPKPTEMHKTLSKPIITQTQPHTTQPNAKQSQPHKTQPQSTATQSQPQPTQFHNSTVNIHPKTTQPQPTTTHPHSEPHKFQAQPITTQSQLRMTHSQNITKIYQPGTTHTKITTTQAQLHTTKTEPHTTQSQPHTTKTQPTTTQTQNYTTQTQPTTTQSQPHTTQTQPQTTKTQPTTTQTQNYTTKTQPTTTQTHPTTTQSQPHTTQTQPQTTQTQPTTTQTQPTTTRSQPHTTQNQPHTTKTRPTTTQTQAHTTQTQPTSTQTQPHTTQTQPTTTQTQPHTTQTQPTSTQTQPHTTQAQTHTIQIQPIKTHTKSTKQTAQSISNILHTTEFQQQPGHHPSVAIKHSNTKTWQNGKTELTLKSEPKQPVGTPPEKSQGEKKPGNQKLPDSKMGQEMSSTSASVASTSAPTVQRVSTVSVPNPITLPPTSSNTTVKKAQGLKAQGNNAQGNKAQGNKAHGNKAKGNKTRISSSQNSSNGERHKGKSNKRKKPESTKTKENLNQVDKDEALKEPTNLKLKNELPLQKPSLTTPPAEIYQKPTPTTAFNGDNSSVFSSVPVSEVDVMGKNRFVAPHVIYQINKPPKQPCSVTNSLSFFPDEENVVANISGPPKTPPSNVTVVTVEGCSSFVIIDWEKTDNETTEYEVTSSEKSPNGKIVSVVTTNQTHTAVENLKPESSYEFKVTPKNELGSGPSSESVTFNTESADPRVSEIRTGKNAIWSSFSFKADSYSECNGNQFVKRTWYRKFVGIQLCNSLRYKIYLSDSLKGKFYNIGDETGYGEDHCQFVDSYLDGRTGGPISQYHLPPKQGFFRSMRQEPVKFGKIGGSTQINYVAWYECGVPIPGSW